MGKPLAPKVEGPVSVLNTDVAVSGVNLGAEVIVFADNAEVGRDSTSAGRGLLNPTGLTVAIVSLATALKAGQQLTASQVVAGETSDQSPTAVTVVGLPPSLPAPILMTFPFAGVEVVSIHHLFPGASLEVSLSGGGPAASRQVSVTTWDTVVHLPRPVAAGDRVTLTLRGDGNQVSTISPGAAPYYGGTGEARLPTPIFLLPPRECDRGIRLGGIVPGANVIVSVDGQQRRVAVAGTKTFIRVGRVGPIGAFHDAGLKQGSDIVVTQGFPSTGQETDPNHPLHGIAGGVGPNVETPTIVGPVCPSSTTLVVTGYRPGAEIHVYVDPVADGHWAQKAEWTHQAPIGETDAFSADGLVDGALVAVTQQPCPGHESPRSTAVKVERQKLSAPRLQVPVLECAQGVVAANLMPGADVSLWSKRLGGPVGPATRALTPQAIFIEALLIPGDDVQVVQIGCVDPAHAASGWEHVERDQLDAPSVDYCYVDDTAVSVYASVGGGGAPASGALVDLFVGPMGTWGSWRGRGRLNEWGWCWIPLAYGSLAANDGVIVQATLCGEPVASAQIPVSVVRPPGEPILRDPADGSTVDDIDRAFTWSDPDAGTPWEAVSYLFTLADSSGANFVFLADHLSANELGARWTPTTQPPLQPGHWYRYWVAGVGRRGKPGPEASAQFSIKAAAKPSPGPGPGASIPAWSKLQIYNCNSSLISDDPAHRHLYVWTRDLDAGGAWQTDGDLPPQYTSYGSCGVGYSTSPLDIELADGHRIELACVDPDMDGCSGNDPDDLSCRRYWSPFPFLGKKDGPVLPLTIS